MNPSSTVQCFRSYRLALPRLIVVSRTPCEIDGEILFLSSRVPPLLRSLTAFQSSRLSPIPPRPHRLYHLCEPRNITSRHHTRKAVLLVLNVFFRRFLSILERGSHDTL